LSDLTRVDTVDSAASFVRSGVIDGAVRAPASPRRRQFLLGMGVTSVGLAAAAALGPDWGAGAPVRMPAATTISSVPSIIAPPRLIQYTAADRAEWLIFRKRYITPEGRVIDTGNANASHSEGQGWGMMGAQACDDRDTFTKIYEWTSHNLQRRPYDCLHAWRYRPGDANPVADTNNATDGDLFIAAALARAAIRWNRPDYAVAAEKLARAILGLVRKAGARTVLLPGAVGFETADAFTINLSYYAFALFNDLAALAPSPLWDIVQRDGVALSLQGRFGRWNLPPDWLRVDRRDGGLSLAMGWPPRFSYDAIRVPLHLGWGRLAAGAVFESFGQYWNAPRLMPPAWVDLKTGEVAAYPAPTGICAVAAFVAMSYQGATGAIPSVNLANDYYSAGLVLLSRLASREGPAA
jgi:endo-1,4-beta-D-glucanase Y